MPDQYIEHQQYDPTQVSSATANTFDSSELEEVHEPHLLMGLCDLKTDLRQT